MARHPYTKAAKVFLPPRKPLGEAVPWFVYSENRRDNDLNSHTPWSKWDEQDIRYAVAVGKSLADTANFLCRPIYEVRDKAKEMGLAFRR
jgi:hypothetical protein